MSVLQYIKFPYIWLAILTPLCPLLDPNALYSILTPLIRSLRLPRQSERQQRGLGGTSGQHILPLASDGAPGFWFRERRRRQAHRRLHRSLQTRRCHFRRTLHFSRRKRLHVGVRSHETHQSLVESGEDSKCFLHDRKHEITVTRAGRTLGVRKITKSGCCLKIIRL